MSIEGFVQQLVFSTNSLNAILTVGIAMLGVSLSLLTLSVAFVVSGKSSKNELRKQIMEEGISISNGSEFVKNNNATRLMTLIAKHSLHWLVLNFVFCGLMTIYILCETSKFPFVAFVLSIVYLIVSFGYIILISKYLINWYRKNI